MRFKILVSHLWIMGSQSKAEFGFVCLVTDVMAQKEPEIASPLLSSISIRDT